MHCLYCGMSSNDLALIRSIGLNNGAAGWLQDPDAICCEVPADEPVYCPEFTDAQSAIA